MTIIGNNQQRKLCICKKMSPATRTNSVCLHFAKIIYTDIEQILKPTQRIHGNTVELLRVTNKKPSAERSGKKEKGIMKF